MAKRDEIIERLGLDRPAIAASISDEDVQKLTTEVIQAIDLIELRIDLFSDTSTEYVKEIFKKAKGFKLPLIATYRAKAEGGHRDADDSERLNVYRELVGLADLMDAEIHSELIGKLSDICQRENTLLIGSFHDFHGTPSFEKLYEVIELGRKKGADIVKIATRVSRIEDIRLLNKLTLREHTKGIITIGMGSEGILTRVFFPIIGSLFTFASVGESKAPGQIPATELREIINKLTTSNTYTS